MNEGPLMPPVGDDERAPRDTARGTVTTWGVLAGIIPGFVVGIAVMFGWVLLADAVTMTSDLADGLIIALPVLVGVVLLAIPATRRAGAGFVAGLAVGSLISAGACIAFIQSFN